MQNMRLALRALMLLTVSLVIVFLCAPRDALGHGKELEKKGGGPTREEVGPHGGAVVDIGDGHFELARDPAGSLSLYRLDDDLKAISAEDVDAAQLYALMPAGQTGEFAMEGVRSVSEPVHFGASSKIAQPGGYLAVVSVAMGDESWNLRFQVK